jgi:mannose-6-phosphate isomerase-like protein (cupin superfamily)
MAGMKNFTRRDVCAALPAFAAIGASPGFAAQVHASESPTPQTPQPDRRTVPVNDLPAPALPAPALPALPLPASAVSPPGTLGAARAIAFDRMPARSMANGGESRAIAHGTLATGESVSLHQSMQPAGAAPNQLHTIQHSEFILVREGELEFQHEVAGQVVSETVGPGGAIYVAFETRHALTNVGSVAARYFVVAVGGDAK